MKVCFSKVNSEKECLILNESVTKMICILWKSDNEDKYYRIKFFGKQEKKNTSFTKRAFDKIYVKTHDEHVDNLVIRLHTDAIDFELKAVPTK